MTDSLLDIWQMKKRAARDSSRHSERIKRAIKENLKDLVADASIISSDGKRKIKIPLKYLDNYRFKYIDNKNKEGVGQGNSSNKPGDAIAHDGTGRRGSGKGDKATQDAGEEIYEEEIELDEIIQMMLDDLGLPWLKDKDNSVEVETENIKFTDLSEVGPLSNVDKRKTIIENLKRNAKLGNPIIKNIRPEDLRYKIWDIEKKYHSNAAVYFLMDRSGSMDDEKKYIAKSFFFWLAHFCKTKYTNVELVFIAHDTTAKIVPEENFFKISNSGGTMCSSAFKLALDHIMINHPASLWNNYVFSFSDGDNYSSDNAECIKIVNSLLDICSAVGYGEISINDSHNKNLAWSSLLYKEFTKNITHERFITAAISRKEDIYSCLKDFLRIRNDDQK